MSAHPALNIIAPSGTFTAAAASVAAWGLHVSDLAVIVSSAAAVVGAVIQLLMYLERRNLGRRGEEWVKMARETTETKREAE